MPDLDQMTPGEILAEASVADFIKSMGLAIAEAQTALDDNSVNQLAYFIEPRPALDGKSLLDLGLSPSFYHYQHADLSVAMQLSIRVETETGFDLNLSGNYGSTSGSTDNSETRSSSSSSGSEERRTHRESRVSISMRTQGALTVNGQNFQLTGDDPQTRIENLARTIRESGNGITRVLPQHECQPVNPQVVPPLESRIITTPNSVTFLGGDSFANAIIRISNVPGAPETWKLKNGTTTTVQPAADKRAHADAVAAAIRALGYTTAVVGNGEVMTFFVHDTDIDTFKRTDAQLTKIQEVAAFLTESRMTVNIVGYADRQHTDEYNVALGQRRANNLKGDLVARGVRADQVPSVTSLGEAPWRNAPGPENNESHRRAEIQPVLGTDFLIFVHGDASHDIIASQVDPNRLGTNGEGQNAFIHVYRPDIQRLTGQSRRIDVGGQSFPLSGAPAAGAVEDHPYSYAANLTRDINANEAAGVRAWRQGETVRMCPVGARYELTLVTDQNRSIEMSGTEDVTITSQFQRSESRATTTQRTGNRTVAVGASIGVRHSRQYEQNVTGNSSISARIVAVPAPPEFLATIKDYLS